MKTVDLARQLQTVVPTLTDVFSDSLIIIAIGQVGSFVTVVTGAVHGLATGNLVTINGIRIGNTITSLTAVGTVAAAVTTTAHGLTEGARGETRFVEISGAADPLYNGQHKLLSVSSVTDFTFEVAIQPVSPDVGVPILEMIVRGAYNGLRSITLVDTTTFTFVQDASFATLTPVLFTNSTLRVRTRIWAGGGSSGGGIGRLVDAYTAQAPGKLTAFVVFGGRIASKDRGTVTDATKTESSGTFYLQNILQSFTVFVFQTVKDEDSLAVDAVDNMADILPILTRSIAGLRLQTTLTCQRSSSKLVYTSDDTLINEGSTYVHQFNFENALEMVPADTVAADDGIALRTFNMIMRDEVIDSDNVIYNDIFTPDF